MNHQNLRQENGMLSVIKIIQFMVKVRKMLQLLSLKLKSLNQVFA